VTPNDSTEDLTYREWGTKEWDAAFLRGVPAGRLAEFRAWIRPLADAPSADLRARLFKGARYPFHPVRATGWMGDALRLERRSRLIPVERMGDEFGWGGDTMAFLVYHTHTHDVLAGRWQSVQQCLLLGWIYTGADVVICADESRWVAVYWEGGGPRCVKRRDRPLFPRV
jgi:hypothetical protein